MFSVSVYYTMKKCEWKSLISTVEESLVLCIRVSRDYVEYLCFLSGTDEAAFNIVVTFHLISVT